MKSTDDSMLETLQKVSGKTHRVYRDSKTVTKDKERLFMQTEGKITYTYTTREMPVISYNDMAFISPRNSIVFRAGDPPMWNRNQTILPMSWKLFNDTIVQPGKNYTLQTIPTLSSAVDFDVRKNQPNFFAMVEKRKLQVRYASDAIEAYKKAYHYSDYDITQLDPDIYSDEIMEVINQAIAEYKAEKEGIPDEELYDNYEMMQEMIESVDPSEYEDNDEQFYATKEAEETYTEQSRAKFAGNTIAPENLVGMGGKVTHAFDGEFVKVFKDCKMAMYKDTRNFMNRNDGGLYGADGTLYIQKLSESKDFKDLDKAAADPESKVYSENNDFSDIETIGSYRVTDAFYRFLAGCETWDFADGKFEEAMAKRMRPDED